MPNKTISRVPENTYAFALCNAICLWGLEYAEYQKRTKYLFNTFGNKPATLILGIEMVIYIVPFYDC